MTGLKHKGQIFLQIKNTQIREQSFTLFNGGITNFTDPPAVILSSSVDYNFLNQMLHEDPIWIKSIQFNGSQFNTLARGMLWRKFDANGKELLNWDQPLNQVSAYQAQSGIATVKYKNLLLDTRSTLTLTLGAGQTIDLLMDYEQWQRTDLFTTDAESVILQKEILGSEPYSETGKASEWDREAIRIMHTQDMFNPNDLNPDFNFN